MSGASDEAVVQRGDNKYDLRVLVQNTACDRSNSSLPINS